ncbi:hypothetical protein C8F04DRAFT_1066155 [Mycena alexandri]|uniref:Uncharacterized protein n=1 Tax=Mycena alexandri TaxID=1745969 RepID=A0AAD6TK99_9AGAR|nr:hypothetical protein C8F04DRAFT_1066155 [Mycena alexandri]
MDLSSSSFNISALPRVLWNLYVDHLWNWTDHPHSWISRIAYGCRVLAILFIMPVVILTLLDLASYGIARTLGIIDDVKASTSDKETIHNKIPLVRVVDPSTPSPSSTSLANTDDSETLLDSTSGSERMLSSTDTLPPLAIFTSPSSSSHPHAYFTSEENSLKLSGVGVFSPAASRPPSPTITRKGLPDEWRMTDVDEGITFRKKRATTTAKE